MKCYFCKKEIKKEDAYMWIHTTKSGKEYKRYCCNLEEKEQHERDLELYKKIQYLTDEILGYPCVNNNRNKRIQELQNAGYTNEQIFRCFKQYKEDIIHWINVNGIDKEFNKLAYMFAVVGANIKDFSVEDDERNNQWISIDENIQEYADENIDTFTEESDEDIINRLKNNKPKSGGIADILNKFK